MTDKTATLNKNVLTNIKGFPYPKWLVIQLLEKCNLRCTMCYEWGKEGSYHNKKDTAQLDINVVKKVIEDVSPGKPYLGLFGGEPFMYPWIYEVLYTAKKFNLNIDIPTNGTLLEKNTEMLVETQPRRLWISLDGPEEINDMQRGKGVYKKVIQGIDSIYYLRKNKNFQYPKIGITIIVTPLNYQYIEKLFLKHIDMSKIDHISIEFQLYATHKQYDEYADILKKEFGINEAPCAKGIIWDHTDFLSINIPDLVKQIKNVKEYCEKKNIYFISYPKTIEEDNINNFFTANWHKMKDRRNHCSFPWLYAEINARGDVSCCHTFYDLTNGNVNEKGILDIWNGEKYNNVRLYLRKNLFPICTACSRYYADPNKK